MAYNVLSESLAAEAAASLGAKKLLFVTDGHSFISDDAAGAGGSNRLVQCMRLADARSLIAHYGLAALPSTAQSDSASENDDVCALGDTRFLSSQPRYASAAGTQGGGPFARFGDRHTAQLVNLVRFSVAALSRGVTRAHLVPPTSGSLLRELYTSDGAGTLISRDLYDGVRAATDSDVPGILDIIEPLVAEGILVRRSAADIAAKLGETYVFVRDGNPVACGMLTRYGPRHAEISCLALAPEYRGARRGDTMLTYLERVALGFGVPHVFVLSTRTLEFFAERGFREVTASDLPPERPYDQGRRSRVFMKTLRGARDLDMEELYWSDATHQAEPPARRETKRGGAASLLGASTGHAAATGHVATDSRRHTTSW